MSIYVQILEVLGGLAGGRIFPLVADEGVETPYIVVQRVGGSPSNFLTGDAPNKQSHRIQVTVWAGTALEAESVSRRVENAIRAAAELQPEVVNGAIDDYDELTGYKGSRQDFTIFC